ncbi:MAG: glycosyl transferase, partial [Asticcacaulis sp. 32-58-5]
TSNLLVRKDVFKTHDFDPEFRGWGWEDVEWAMRVSADFGIDHIDNTATHMGLDTADVLLSKYEQSGANFARVVRKHPEIVTRYPSYKMARLIKTLPFSKVVRGGLKSLVQSQSLPLKARAFALRLYRASVYADAL